MAGLAALIGPNRATAQTAFTSWLNAKIDLTLDSLDASAQQNDPNKMQLTPAGSATRSSIIDRAGLPDVAGISIAMPTAPAAGGGAQPPATSLGISPYMVLALIRGQNPLEPTQYLKYAVTRRLGLSSTFETDPQTGNSVSLYQGKLIVLDRGDPLATPQAISALQAVLPRAGTRFETLRDSIGELLWIASGKPGRDIDFINRLETPANLDEALARSITTLPQINSLVQSSVGEFAPVRDTVAAYVEKSRARPELAVGFTQRGSGADRASRAVAIFDVAKSFYDITANLAYNDSLRPTVGRGANVEGALQAILRLSPDDPLTAKAPLSITLAGSLDKPTIGIDTRVMYKLQGVMLMPVAAGVNIPISATWASRPSLIEEKKVVGNIGFSFDVAQLMGALH